MTPSTAVCSRCGRELPIADHQHGADEVDLVADPYLAEIMGVDDVDWMCGSCYWDRAASI